MGIEDIVSNVSAVGGLPPELVSSMSTLITILKAAGILFIAYILYLVISSILGIRKSIKITKIHKKVEEIDKKLDVLLKRVKNKKQDKKK